MTDPVEIMARAIHASADKQDYTGDFGFPRGENGALTTLDGQFDLADFAKAALRALTASGYAVVPLEPTDAIKAAMSKELEQWDRRFDGPDTIAHNAYIEAVEVGSVKLGEE